MPDPLAPDSATRIARAGSGIRSQLRRMIERIQSRHMLAKQVFCSPDGELTKPAREWMRRLAQDNYVLGGGFDQDPYVHARNEGRRALALEILGSTRIDAERLGALIKKERESSE